jgi:hypothetical protein
MYDLAVGDMQMKAAEFEQMTWGEFMCRYAGHCRQIERDLSNTRLTMYAIFQKGNKRKIKPQDIFTLTIDKQQKRNAPLMSKERFEYLKQRIASKN